MDEDLNSVTLLDENLWKLVERKLMYINDPTLEFSKPIASSTTHTELNLLLEQMGRVRFQITQPSTKPKSKLNSLNLHREIDIQLEEVSTLLEKFQEKFEENETEQEILAEEIEKESQQVKLLESTLHHTSENFESRIGIFEKLLKEATKVCEESKNLVQSGREKAFLEATVNKFEVEREKSLNMIEDLQYEIKVLTEKLNKTNTDYDYNLKRIKSDYESLYKDHSMLKQKHFELINSTTSHNSVTHNQSKELDQAKQENSKLVKKLNLIAEELKTKEEVHSSLKKTIIDLSEQLDKYKTQAKTSTDDLEKKSRQSDMTTNNLQIELNKVKTSWMHDLETLAQTRLERDSIHTQYNLLDQKYNKISQENKVLRSKIEELKQEARANFEASKFVVPLDKNVKTATGSIAKIEVDYYRELENMKRNFEVEVEKLAEEVEWYKAKLETERQWSHSLELANKHLNEQIEDFRKMAN